MKKIVRARKTPNRLPSNRQAQTPATPGPQPPCVAILEDGISAGLVNLEPGELQALKARAAASGQSLDETLLAAVRQMLAPAAAPQPDRPGRQRPAYDPIMELESAKNQSIALMWLMHDSETYHMTCGDFNEDLRNTVNAGVSRLVDQTTDALSQSFDAVFAQMPPRRDTSATAPAGASEGGAQ